MTSNNRTILFYIQRIIIFCVGLSFPFNQVKWEMGGRPVTLSVFVVFLYTVFMIPSIGMLSQLHKRYSKIIYYPLLFFVILTINNAVTYTSYNTPTFDISIFSCILMYLLFLLHQSKDETALRYALAGFAIGCIVLSYFFYTGYQVSATPSGRVVVLGENANAIGLILVIGTIIIWNEFILKDFFHLKRYRYLWGLSFVLLLPFIIACASRSAFIILVLSFIGSVLLYPSKNSHAKFALIVIASIVIIYAYSFFVNSDTVLLNRLLNTVDEGDTGARDEIFLSLLPAVFDNLVLGVGQTGYVDISDKYLGLHFESNGVTYGFSPHNVFLEVMLYTGCVGFYFMMIFWYKTLKSAYTKYKLKNDPLIISLTIPVMVCLLSGQMLARKWAYLLYAFFLIP